MDDNDIQASLQKAILGETAGKLQTGSRDSTCEASLRMAEQARLGIRITSRDLDHPVYDTLDFYNAAKNLIISSRYAHIYILLNSAERIVKNGHRLLSLKQRMSTFIDIRVQGKRFREYNEAILIADNCGYIRRPLADRYEAEVDFNAPRIVRDMTRQFEEMWAESEVDPSLGRLHI